MGMTGMPTIERKPLPPPNSRAATIAEADRAEIIAHANDVIDYYLNGGGSYFDGGTQKPLVSEFGESTIDDLKNFKANIIASKQFADDPNSIMDSVIDLIDKKITQVEEASKYKEGENGIWALPPNTNDPIDDPRIISPRLLSNAALPISLNLEDEDLTSRPKVGAMVGISRAKPIRYLSRRDGSAPPASVFDTGAPAAQFVLPDQLNSSSDPTHRAAALAGRGSLNPMQAAPLPQAGGTPGISSTRPVRYLSRTIADKPQASIFDASAPAVPFALSNDVSSADRRNPFASGRDASSLAVGVGDSSSMRGLQGPTPSTLLEYIRDMNQLSANKPQASMVDPDAPEASLAPSGSPSLMGGLAGRIAALAGIDPDTPDRPVPPPGGLLALLFAAQQR
jgi:hypothetical protein